MINPGNAIKATFDAFESLFWRVVIIVAAVVLVVVGLIYLVTR